MLPRLAGRPHRPAGRGGRRRPRRRAAPFPPDAAVCVVLASAGLPRGAAHRGDRRSRGLAEAVLRWTGSPCSTPAPARRPATTWSPPAAGSSASPASATSLEAARGRAYEGVSAVIVAGMQRPTDRTDHRRRAPAPRPPAARRRSDDPPLRAAGHGRAVHRPGPPGHLARGRAAGHRGLGRPSARCPPEAAAACRERAPVVDAAFVEAVAERERVTDHDVAAFVDVVQDAIGQPEGSWIHYGLTSSDVVDTALCATLTGRPTCSIVGLRAGWCGAPGRGPGSDRHAGDRPHPRHARRADHLRGQVRPVGAAGRPRPPAARGGPAPGGGGQALRARSGRIPTSTRGSRPTCAGPWASPRCRPPR